MESNFYASACLLPALKYFTMKLKWNYKLVKVVIVQFTYVREYAKINFKQYNFVFEFIQYILGYPWRGIKSSGLHFSNCQT